MYRISSSPKINRQFEELCAQADSEGRGAFALASADALMQQIQDDPFAVGEPKFELKHLKLQVRLAIRLPWSVHFAVDQQHHIVFVTRIALLDPL